MKLRNTVKRKIVIITLCLFILALSACGNAVFGRTPDQETAAVSLINVTITVGDQSFAACFYDNESTRAIVSQMPFTLVMEDYAAQEKVTDLPFTLPTAPTETPATINTGDIYLWSGNSLVLFYTTFSNSYSYVPVGYVTDVTGLTEVLGTGTIEITFSTALTS